MRKYLIGRDRTLYGWNAEMAKQNDLYEIDLDATSAADFQFPDSDNNLAPPPVRIYPAAVGDTADEALAAAQIKAAAGLPFLTTHPASITLTLDVPPGSPEALAVRKEATSGSEPIVNEDPRPGENAALLRAKGVSDRDQGEAEANRTAKGIHDIQEEPRGTTPGTRPNDDLSQEDLNNVKSNARRDRDDNLSDEDRERAAADRKARAQKIIDDAKAKKRGPHPDNSLPEDQGKNGDER